MKILVTGAGGYIGPAVMSALESTGVEIKVCDIGWFKAARVRTGKWCAADHPDFTTLSTDLLKHVDAVIHLAGYSNDPIGYLHPDETMRLNFHETISLAQRSRDAGVGVFVFASSCSVYGDSGDTVMDEDHTPSPLTPYASSKALAEDALIALQTNDFRVRILRGATAFGASPVPRTDLLLNELCAHAALGQSATLRSTGDSWRPFMPVEDFARALSAAALNEPANMQQRPIWNIAPPRMQMTVRDAANLTAKVAGLPSPSTAEGATHDNRSYRVDGTRFADNFPMFRYTSDFMAQLSACIKSYLDIPGLETDLQNKRFVRLETFRRSRWVAE
ncbi:SDR family oxidoreductase [Roseovarius aestuarii]|nr:SDR family oxidoreductase [Roseovarius aestuarii]